MTVRPDENGNVENAGVVIPVALLTAMAVVDVTGKALKLADGRIQFRGTPNGTTTEVTYTVALTVTREPIDGTESARIAVKLAEQEARKADKAEKELATRERDLKRAAQDGRDGVLSVMARVGDIAQAAHVLAAISK